MKRIVLIVLCLLLCGVLYAEDLDTYKQKYKEGLEEISGKSSIDITKLNKQYSEGLDALLAKMQKTGDLDKTVAVMEEIERFKKTSAAPVELSTSQDVKRLQEVYLRQAAKVSADKAKKIVLLSQKYDKALGQMQKKLVTSGDIDGARAIQNERKRLAESEIVVEARNKLKNAKRPRPKSVTPKPQPKRDVPLELEIEALVDGDTELHVTTKGISWVSGGVAKPGRHGGVNEPTLIAGKKWFPKWGKPDEDRGRDRSDVFSFEIDSLELEVEVIAMSGRQGGTDMWNRSPIRTRKTDEEFVIIIPDPEPGSCWYRLLLSEK